MTGIDIAADALAVAHAHDASGRVRYVEGDALALPFDDGSFDAVCAMDLLEHLESPERAIAEASRVLAPGGLFFFHTFNRNLLSWLVIIEGVERFVRNTPEHMHVLRLFLKPEQVRAACAGARPRSAAARRRTPQADAGRSGGCWSPVGSPSDFAFTFTRSTRLAYTGVARKRPAAHAASRDLASAPSLRLRRPPRGSRRAERRRHRHCLGARRICIRSWSAQ